MKRTSLLWLLALLSAAAFGLAGVLGSLGPASECSTRLGLHLMPALAALAAAAALGLPVMLNGSRLQRAALFLTAAALFALYLFGLSEAVPMAIATEAACLTGG